MHNLHIHTKRVLAAMFLVVICITAIPIVQVILDSSQISRAVANDKSSESVTFSEEVCKLDGIEIGNFSEECDSRVVGFNMSENASVSFSMVSDRLIESGWRAISSGAETISTFVKPDGTYTWALLQATDVGTGSCITITLN